MEEKTLFNYSINDGFLWSEVNLKGERQYFIEGYASTIDEDKAGEILDLSAQKDIYDQMRNQNITMDIEHEEWYDDSGKVLARPKNEKIPVAKIIHAELRPQGVWVKAQLNTHLRSFSEVWGSIKDGFLKAFSVAFYPIQKAGGVIKHLNLVNVTLTGSPVNPNATFAVSMKSASAWLDTVEAETKAELKPKVDTPGADIPGVEPPKEEKPKHPKMTEVKAEEESTMKCKECDKEFESKEALEDHMEEKHGKELSGDKEEDKKEEPEMKAEEVEAPVVDIKAQYESELKAMKEKLEVAEKTHSEEVAKLKAELEKPQLKSVVEPEVPVEKPFVRIVSPLGLVR